VPYSRDHLSCYPSYDFQLAVRPSPPVDAVITDAQACPLPRLQPNRGSLPSVGPFTSHRLSLLILALALRPYRDALAASTMPDPSPCLSLHDQPSGREMLRLELNNWPWPRSTTRPERASSRPRCVLYIFYESYCQIDHVCCDCPRVVLLCSVTICW